MDLRHHDLKEHELSTRELTTQLTEQLSRLVHDEMALAKAELFASSRRAIRGGAILVVAIVAAYTGWLALVAAMVAGIAVALPVWAAALVTGGAFLLISGVCVPFAIRSFKGAAPPLQMTAESVRGELHELTSKVRK